MVLNWKLTVWPATGGTSREVQRDVSFVLGEAGRGLRLQVTPEGECREAVFSAKGAGLQITPLSAVQVSYLNGGAWMPVFFGEVRRGGNSRDVQGEDYALRGLSRRLEEVTLSPGFSAPEQAAHLTVQAIIQDVIASGQVGTPSLVLFDAALCPDLGFNCRAVVDAAQQNPAALLQQIVEDGAKYGVTVRWGVRPDRVFFCRTAKVSVRDVTLEAPVIKWAPPVAETPCTAVLWYVARADNGRWITHLSRSADADVYGVRVKAVSLTSDEGVWVPGSMTLTVNAGAGVDVWPNDGAQTMTHDITDAIPKLMRKTKIYTSARVYLDRGQTGAELTVTLSTPDAQRLTILSEFGFVGDHLDPATGGGTFLGRQDTWAALTVDGERVTQLVSGAVAAFVRPFTTATIALNLPARPGPVADWTANMWFDTIRVEHLNRDLLDGLAAFHYVSPAQEPADIETMVFVPPGDLPGRVRVTGALAGGPAYEHALEAVEYRISSRGMLMGWLAGQADDPAALAQASLIRKRDGQAVVTALTAQR